MTTRVAILVFDEVDLLDVGGPYEVFLTASRLELRRGRPGPFEVAVVGVTGESAISYGGSDPLARITSRTPGWAGAGQLD